MKLVFLEPPNLRFSTRLDFSTASLLAETPQNLPTNIDAVEPATLTLIKSLERIGCEVDHVQFPRRDVGSDQVCQFHSALLRISRGSMNRVCEGFSTWLSISRAGSRISFGN
jgi:hypothetical protein